MSFENGCSCWFTERCNECRSKTGAAVGSLMGVMRVAR